MGLALKMSLDFHQAGRMLAKVLDLDDEYVEDADRQWKLIKKILKAAPDSRAGKEIAVVDNVTRAEVAALLIEELKLDEIYKGLGVKRPVPSDIEKEPKDIVTHSYRHDIEQALIIGVRGLERYPDGEFHPDDVVTKVIMAAVIEDILVKITGDTDLATKYEGIPSPYPYLRNDLPYYNAMMMVISMDVMDAEVFTSSKLSPFMPLSGADALVTIKNLKDVLISL